MTARELINAMGEHSWVLVIAFGLPTLLVLLMMIFHKKEGVAKGRWKYIYSVLVYLVCAPGILAAVLTCYTMFFTKESMLDVNMLVYLLPLFSMGATLALIWRLVGYENVPGFKRLSGLMTTIGMAFVIVLIISKTRIWLFFGGSIFLFFALAAGIFGLLKWGAYTAFRSKDQPHKKPPTLPIK